MMRGRLTERGWSARPPCCGCSSVCRSRASWVSEETTAKWVSGFSFEPKNMLTKMNTAMRNGIMIVVMRKPRVRIRSMYSRRAMSQTLCIEAVSVGLVELGHGKFAAIFDGQ